MTIELTLFPTSIEGWIGNIIFATIIIGIMIWMGINNRNKSNKDKTKW